MNNTAMEPNTTSDQQAIEQLTHNCAEMRKELARVIVGQEEVIEQLITVLLARGHALLEGVPGLAKTLLISTLANTMDLGFRRVQFTPDLMPSDILGSEVLQDDPETGERRFKFVKGPIFTNIMLADEINRTPPKTQAALLEAMAEKRISTGSEDFKLDPPFFVLATQNPVEQEGTYPLPEAQLDRFLYKIIVDYPERDEEIAIIKQVSNDNNDRPKAVMDKEAVIAAQDVVRRVVVPDAVVAYAADIIRSTRIRQDSAPDFVKENISWGAGPRASISLVIAAKVRAAINGRYHVGVDDIRAVAQPILRHRIITNFTAQAQGLTSDDIITKILDVTPAPGAKA